MPNDIITGHGQLNDLERAPKYREEGHRRLKKAWVKPLLSSQGA